GAGWSQQVGQQQLVEPGSLVAEIKARGVAERVEAVRQEKVGGVVGVVVSNGAGGFPKTDLGHARLPINRSQTSAAHGAILVEKQFGTIEAPVVIEPN